MEITQLKLKEEVDINGHDYQYEGIQKRNIENFGKVECFVFQSPKLPEKTFLRSKSKKFTIKDKEGKLTLCTLK